MTDTMSPGRATTVHWSKRKPSSIRDFALGARLSVGGGRTSWWRFISITIGVGLGVGLLVLGACVPSLILSRSAKSFALDASADGPAVISVEPVDNEFRSNIISGQLVGALPGATSPPIPPGLDHFPAADEFFVSPALQKLLDDPSSALLRERFPLPVTGLISQDGLVAPNDLRFYLGTTANPDYGSSGWTHSDSGGYFDASGWTILITFGAVLTLPIMVFIGVASRTGGTQRNAMITSLRRVGASRKQLRRIVAGETLPPVLAGLALTAVLFAIARLVSEHITVFNFQVFGSDLDPEPIAMIALGAAILVLSVWVGWLAPAAPIAALDQPCALTPVKRRKLLWRLALAALGLALTIGHELLPDFSYSGVVRRLLADAVWAGGALLLIGAVPLILPVVFDAMLRRLPPGGPASTLAVRGLQTDATTVSRIISGLAVLIAATIGFQAALHAAQRPEFGPSTTVVVTNEFLRSSGPSGKDFDLIGSLPTAVPGTHLLSWSASNDALVDETNEYVTVRVADCEQLKQWAELPSCADDRIYLGDAYTLASDQQTVSIKLQLFDGFSPSGETLTTERVIEIPHNKITTISGSASHSVLMTPSAVKGISGGSDAVNEFRNVRWEFDISAGGPDAAELIRNQLSPAMAQFEVYSPDNSPQLGYSEQTRQGYRLALTIGTLLALLFAALTLALHAAENARNRRRLLALMVAGGVPPSVLGRAQFIAAAIPLGVALIVGFLVGGSLALVVGWAGQGFRSIDWPNVGLYLAAAAILTVITGLIGLHSVKRAARPDALQTT